MQLQPTEYMYTIQKTKKVCPIQPVYSSEAEGRIDVFEEYAVRLKDI